MRQYQNEKSHIISSIVVNKIISELLKYTKPFYTQSIIEKIGVKTQFKKDAVETNFDIEFVTIEPYVEFIKRINGSEVSSTKFKFGLDSRAHIKKLKISNYHDKKSIDIEKIQLELELFLKQIISGINRLNKPIRLANKKFEIKNITFYLKD